MLDGRVDVCLFSLFCCLYALFGFLSVPGRFVFGANFCFPWFAVAVGNAQFNALFGKSIQQLGKGQMLIVVLCFGLFSFRVLFLFPQATKPTWTSFRQ